MTEMHEDQEVLDLLATMEEIEPPGNLPERFRARLARSQEQSTARWGWWPTLLAAGIAIVLGGGWFAERQSRRAEVASLRVELETAVAGLSAARRLVAVNATRSATMPDAQLVEVLTHVLLTDESPSVRIAAIEAIASFGTRSQLASAINQGLGRESSALVQSALLGVARKLDAEERTRAVTGFVTRTDLDPVIVRDARSLLAL